MGKTFTGQLDYTDLRIFGNEAGEDEDPGILASYFVNKPEFDYFEDDQNSFSIVRGLRGTEKSALLSRLAFMKQQNDDSPLVLFIKGPELVAGKPFESKNPLEYIYEWQQRMCSRINGELGRDIGIALDDRSMSMVEHSELQGFKGRNLVGALLERLNKKIGPISLSSSVPQNAHSLLQNYLGQHNNRKVWLLIDDIDATFTGSPDETLRLSTFFSACRQLSHSVKGLIIRCSVRTDVWTVLNMSDESLDKCRQYVIDLLWTANGISLILTHRLRAFIAREYQQTFNDSYDADGYISVKDRERYLNSIFPKRYYWQDRQELPTKVIHILSSGRPRMALQLCRMAGSYAKQLQNKGHTSKLIKLNLLSHVVKPFGRNCLRDLISENRHQCSALEDIIYAFSRTKARFSTGELIDFIEDKIRSKRDIYVHDKNLPANSFQIAHLLYRINFIVGCDYATRPIY